MKKQYLFLILIYSVVVLVGVTLVVMDSFNLNFSLVFGNLSQAFHFLFNMFFVVLSLLILLYILWAIANDNSMRSVNQDLRRIINNQPVKRQGDIELDKNMMRLSHKMRKLTKDLQKLRMPKPYKAVILLRRSADVLLVTFTIPLVRNFLQLV